MKEGYKNFHPEDPKHYNDNPELYKGCMGTVLVVLTAIVLICLGVILILKMVFN